jgi:hypothetical protein
LALRFAARVGNMATIVVVFFAIVGVGSLALIAFFLYLTPGAKDRL